MFRGRGSEVKVRSSGFRFGFWGLGSLSDVQRTPPGHPLQSLEKLMTNTFKTAFLLAGGFVIATAAAAMAQAPAAAPAAPSGIVVAKPTYTFIPLEIAVNKPAADVWKRVGKFCDIGEWLRIPCTITSGTDGELGAIRSVANEVLVGK